MATYRTNPAVKIAILEEARKLFYNNGYNETSIDQIAKALDISKGLISYHYKTKFDLANAVYDEYRIGFLHEVTKKINKQYGNLESKYYDAIQLRITFRLYKKDYKARRFYMQIAPELLTQSKEEHYQIIYGPKAHYYYMELDYSKQEDVIMQYASSAAVTAIRLLYLTGGVKSDYEFVEDSCIRTTLLLLKVKSDEIEEIIKVGREITNSLNIKFKPYFIMV